VPDVEYTPHENTTCTPKAKPQVGEIERPEEAERQGVRWHKVTVTFTLDDFLALTVIYAATRQIK